MEYLRQSCRLALKQDVSSPSFKASHYTTYNVSSSDNQIHSEVLNPWRDTILIEQDSVPNRRNADPKNSERVSVAKPVRDECGENAEECRND